MEQIQVYPPLKAIRRYCLSCGEDIADVRNCTIKKCPLYPYRMGKRPVGNEFILPQYKERKNATLHTEEGAD